MAATLISAAVLCVCALFVGQAALRLCGAREWNWMAPAVGLSLLMLIATPAIDLPGRATTMAILLCLLSVAAIVWCMSSPAHRPPISGVTAAVPTLAMALVPFLAAGHSGILGVTIDNDMQAHMQFAETYLSQAVENLKPNYYNLYPFGPHAIAGTLARGLGVNVDHSFAGLTMALPVLNGWTVLALLRRDAAWWKKWVAAGVVAMPYLVAAYYGQGSFKELTETGLVLATVAFFAGAGPQLGRGRWVPFALLIGGMVSVYSETGLAWPVVIGAIWLVVVTGQRIYRRGTDGIVDEARTALPAVGIGVGVLILALLPQVGRIHNFISANSGANGIIVPKDVLANLVGPLPGWEGFGVWHSMDYRLPQSSAFIDKLWIGIVIALVLFGAYRLIRGGRWLLPLAALGSMVIWRVSMHTQSPYVVAKALVIASPLLLACALLPLLDLVPDHLRPLRDHRLRWGAALVGAVFIVLVVGVSSVRALRYSPVGPTYHAEQLAELSPLLNDQPTLFLGDDDFIHQELPGVPVEEPLSGGIPEVETRPQKKFAEGAAADFDTVPANKLNEFDYVITTRDAAGSQPPPQMKLVKETPSYQLWKRTGTVRERSILAEGEEPGAVLDCSSPAGRKVLAGGGVAAVRPAPVVTEAPAFLPPNSTAAVELHLGPGEWELTAPYVSRVNVKVSGPGIDTTLGGNLDRGGSRYPLGKVDVKAGEPVLLEFKVPHPLLALPVPYTSIYKVVATKVSPERVVPIRQACGNYVDWYRGGGAAR
ncbi:MAG TPA: hypothetical protein VJ204_10125 [Solirubrobacterales bacterium]|nr:hypothetical protein [Solirubrobacterales bacterium]